MQNKIELIKTITRMYAGREKNLKKAKFLRKEIARSFTVKKETK